MAPSRAKKASSRAKKASSSAATSDATKRVTRSAYKRLAPVSEPTKEEAQEDTPEMLNLKEREEAREQAKYLNPEAPEPAKKTHMAWKGELNAQRPQFGDYNANWQEEGTLQYPAQRYQNALNLPEGEFSKVTHPRAGPNGAPVIPGLSIEDQNDDLAMMGIAPHPVKRGAKRAASPSGGRAAKRGRKATDADAAAVSTTTTTRQPRGIKRKADVSQELPESKRSRNGDPAAEEATLRRSSRAKAMTGKAREAAAAATTTTKKAAAAAPPAPPAPAPAAPAAPRLPLAAAATALLATVASAAPAAAKGKRGAKASATGKAKKAGEGVIPAGFVGVPSYHGYTTNPPANAQLAQPWQCAQRACATGMPWMERSTARKTISQFFGRNKGSTASIPFEVWHVCCRKHYQTGAYSSRKADKANKNAGTAAPDEHSLTMLNTINEQLTRLEIWRPNATFTVQLTVGARTRLATFHTLLRKNGGNVAQAIANMPLSKFDKQESDSKTPDADFPILLVEHFVNTFAGASKSYNDLRQTVAWCIGEINALNADVPCPMEFLINAALPDELINDPTYNYQQWEAHKAGTVFDLTTAYTPGQQEATSQEEDEDSDAADTSDHNDHDHEDKNDGNAGSGTGPTSGDSTDHDHDNNGSSTKPTGEQNDGNNGSSTKPTGEQNDGNNGSTQGTSDSQNDSNDGPTSNHTVEHTSNDNGLTSSHTVEHTSNDDGPTSFHTVEHTSNDDGPTTNHTVEQTSNNDGLTSDHSDDQYSNTNNGPTTNHTVEQTSNNDGLTSDHTDDHNSTTDDGPLTNHTVQHTSNDDGHMSDHSDDQDSNTDADADVDGQDRMTRADSSDGHSDHEDTDDSDDDDSSDDDSDAPFGRSGPNPSKHETIYKSIEAAGIGAHQRKRPAEQQLTRPQPSKFMRTSRAYAASNLGHAGPTVSQNTVVYQSIESAHNSPLPPQTYPHSDSSASPYTTRAPTRGKRPFAPNSPQVKLPSEDYWVDGTPPPKPKRTAGGTFDPRTYGINTTKRKRSGDDEATADGTSKRKRISEESNYSHASSSEEHEQATLAKTINHHLIQSYLARWRHVPPARRPPFNLMAELRRSNITVKAPTPVDDADESEASTGADADATSVSAADNDDAGHSESANADLDDASDSESAASTAVARASKPQSKSKSADPDDVRALYELYNASLPKLRGSYDPRGLPKTSTTTAAATSQYDQPVTHPDQAHATTPRSSIHPAFSSYGRPGQSYFSY